MRSKHVALPIFLISILFIVFLYIQVIDDKEEGTFDVLDRYGDRSALVGVQISGEWLDGYYRTFFRVSDERIQKQTEIYSVPRYKYDPMMHWGADLDGVFVQIHGSFTSYELKFQELTGRKVKKSGSIQVNTSVTYSGLDDGRTRSYANQLEYGLTRIQDDLYFTIPTTKHYAGNNGIYKAPLNGDSRAEEIVAYSLEQNKEENGAELEVLGLESVGEQVILVLTEGNSLLLKSFRRDGQYVGELQVSEVNFAEGDRAHSTQYEVFADHEQNKLNLLFHQPSTREHHKNISIVSIDLQDGIQIAEFVQHAYFEDVYDSMNTIREVRHLNDRMILVQTESFKHEQIPTAVYMKRFMIYVFQAGELQYQGEVLTDLNDDLIRAMNRQREGYGYDYAEHRQFDHIRIEERRSTHD